MSNNTDLSKLAAVLDTGTSGQVLTSLGGSNFSFADGATGTGVTVHANQAAMTATSPDEGSLHYVTADTKLYVKMASGFYLLATVSNVTPTINNLTHTTDGTTATIADAATFDLTSGQNTVITLAASDPDVGQSLTYSATLTAGTLSDVASGFTQGSGADVNKFTIVPQTSGTGGSITYRFDVTDGVGTAQRTASFSIAFQIQNSRYTSLLMSANAAGTNSTFTDSSSSGHTITASGNPVQGSFTPYRKGGYSVEFDGNDYLKVADSNDFHVSSSADFTLEAWVYLTNLSANNQLVDTRPSGANGDYFTVAINTSNKIYMYSQSATKLTSAASVPLNQWVHVSYVRASNTGRWYVNGTADTNTWTDNIPYHTSAAGADWWIGTRQGSAGSWFNDAKIRDFRFVNGTAIIPPSGGPAEPLTAVTNTKLLACSTPYIGDANLPPKAITVSGDPKTAPSGPFDFGESVVTDGGSISLDGSDYLSVATSTDFNMTNQDFNISFWYYRTATGVYQTIASQLGTWALEFVGNNLKMWMSSGTSANWDLLSEVTITPSDTNLNVWNYISIVRDSSAGTLKSYKNGSVVYTNSSFTGTVGSSTNPIRIGDYNGNFFIGSIADFRMMVGSDLSSVSTSVPTSQLTAVTNTKLLVSGQGAKIFDKSQTQNFELSGAQANATNKGGSWSGTFSTRLSSTSDYVKFYDKPITGTMDFTIEAFLKWDSTTGFNTTLYSHYYGNHKRGVLMYDNRIYLASASNTSSWGPELILGTPPSAGTWYHVAAVRHGANLYGFINGTRTASSNIGATFDVNDPDHATALADNFGRIGAGRVLATTPLGYISDFRITHGFARYTAADETGNIPTAPLKG